MYMIRINRDTISIVLRPEYFLQVRKNISAPEDPENQVTTLSVS